ncbi:MAG: hypothetical protein B1H04_02455 [Planctomycetales bacterium 4484_123]|nr:MAG: hypothetical protein B1H04_02455 [Planctomycetales bacterium 4484_123]
MSNSGRKGRAVRRAFERKLRSVRRRLSLNVLLRQAGAALAVAGAAAAVAAFTERALAVRFLAPWHVPAAVGAALAVALVVWYLRRPTPMQSALLLDERLRARERFSTAVALAGSDDPFAAAAREEARHRAEVLQLGGHFPVRPTRRWLWAAAAWAAFAGCLLLPDIDLLGLVPQRRQRQRRMQELARARCEVSAAVKVLKASVQQLGDKTLVEELAKLADLQQPTEAAQVRREAIRRLGSLAERVKEMKKHPRARAGAELQSMLKRLRASPQGLDNQLNAALARGDFGRASQLLQDLRSKLQAGALSKKDRRALTEQMEDLAKQLKRLAEQRKALREALKRAGCESKLADLDEQGLRQALKDAGLTDEEIEELMKKARACNNAASLCRALADKLGRCAAGLVQGELVPAGLVGLVEDLEDLEAEADRLSRADAALGDIEDAIALLGRACGSGPGLAGNEPDAPPGGPWARAWGRRATGPESPTGLKKTGVKNKPSAGPVIASWYFKGPQVKGQARRKYRAVVEAARDRAAEAISDNQVPRQYQSAVKKYFGEMAKPAQ